MGYFLKFWSKYWKLIGADNGYLSSYALQLMIIAFLQGGLEQPVLPNLQDFDEDKHSQKLYYLQRGSFDNVCETNGYFITNPEEHIKLIHEKFGVNRLSTAELVFKFFDFYLNSFDDSKAISVKHGGFCDKLNDSFAFSIVDPFQTEHNPGQGVKTNSTTYKIIALKFKEAIEKVNSGENVFNA